MKFKTISVADSKTLIKESKPMILDCRAMKDYRASGREKVVEQLLAAAADQNLKTQDDFTALDLASTRKILKQLSKLVKSGD